MRVKAVETSPSKKELHVRSTDLEVSLCMFSVGQI